jgi:uncharacterized protein (DUF736 family)
MSVIGTFSPSRDGGWIGTIRTLTLDAQVRQAPAFRVIIAARRIGDTGFACERGSQNQRKNF